MPRDPPASTHVWRAVGMDTASGLDAHTGSMIWTLTLVRRSRAHEASQLRPNVVPGHVDIAGCTYFHVSQLCPEPVPESSQDQSGRLDLDPGAYLLQLAMGLAATQARHAREVSDAVPLALLDRPRQDERPEGQALDREGLALSDALRQEHGKGGEQAAHGATARTNNQQIAKMSNRRIA